MPEFASEKPYIVATPSGNKVSDHYASKEAVASAKKGHHRIVYGRHRGFLHKVLEYKRGVLISSTPITQGVGTC